MKLIRSSERKWEDKQGYSKKIILDEKDLNHPGALVQLLRIKPKEVVKAHYHKKQMEIFYFLNDNGYFVVNGKRINLESGDVLVIGPNDKHSVVNSSDEDFVYIAFKLNYDPDDFYWG